MYGPSSSMVDYTAERRKTEREREKENVSHHRATTEREEIFFFREIKNETVLKYATMKFFHKFCSFWSVPTFLYGRLHREKKD